jgi:16S rRNA pseudouridine516 synthase
MQLRQVLFSQGFGTRRECDALIQHGLVQVAERLSERVADDPHEDVDTAGLVFSVRGQAWPFHERALLMMNKPPGYECSRKPKHHPSVMSLLPAPLRNREVQPIGRLDEDTTGLLLFTDDGALIHKLTSPKWHVPKLYALQCADPVTPAQIQQLLGGVVLHDDPLPVCAAACEAVGERGLLLTLTEGKYHQVKRMVAAAGNHVLALQRTAFGALQLPADLQPGQWRWVERAAIAPGL